MNFLNKRILLVAFSLGAAMLAPGTASADFIVMTDPNTKDATVNGGIFSVLSAGSGTGIFPSFVQIHAQGNNTTEEAYNTKVNNVLDNGSSSQHNHEIQAGNIAVKTIGSQQYFVFQLDINENSGGKPSDQYISLDSLKIYSSTIPNQSTTNPDALGAKQYDMGSNTVLLDYSNFSGSGQADLVVLIPVWAGVNPTDYVYLYSAFGSAGEIAANTYTGTLVGGSTYGNPDGNYGASDGFEEWAETLGGTPLSPVPAPASLLLAATGLLGLGLARFRRMVRRGPLAA